MHQALRADSRLQGGRYRIVKELGSGGFGITYLAIQSGLERQVAVKEFFMKDLCNRDEGTSRVSCGSEGSRQMVDRFREKFLKEASNLARLNHAHIVKVIDVFEENGTAYYVMEYAEGGSLAEKVKREGYLSEPVAIRYILQVADALDYIHQRSMNHLDVKPGNIMLDERDEAILIDFGLSKQYDAETGSQTSTTPVGISEGYAPIEQYRKGGVSEFSPQTDIYALGATLYKLLTGSTPPSASEVNEDGVPMDKLQARGISQPVIDTISQAMEGRKKDRLQSIQAFVSALRILQKEEEEKQEPAPEDTLIRGTAEPKEAPVPVEKPRAVDVPPVYSQKKAKEDNGDTIIEKPTSVKTDEMPRVKSKKVGNGFVWKMIVAVFAVACIAGGVYGIKSCDRVAEPMCIVDGHEWVDLGLPSGTKWATMNVGATSPSDYGGYYAWGETDTKSNYTWETLKYYQAKNSGKFSKYVTDRKSGRVDGRLELDPDDDVASVNWGSGWRTPSKIQQDELRKECKWTWTIMGKHYGYKVVGPNGNSIFLPAAGYRYGTDHASVGSLGYYWSRTLRIGNGWNADILYFNSTDVKMYYNSRRHGRSIRPVLAP